MDTFVGTVWYSLLVLVVSLLAGWLVDLLLTGWLLAEERKTRWRAAAAIAESLRGYAPIV